MNKKFMLFGALGLFAIALVSALAYYSFFTVTLNLTNPIQVIGDGDQTINNISPPEVVLGSMITITNDDVIDREIVINTTITQGDISNVEVNYVGRLELDNKDSTTWTRIADSREGELYYFITGDNFGYHFEAQGLDANTEYALIYYLDSGATDPITGKPWNLNNAIEIHRLTSDGLGDLVMEGSNPLSDLPFSTDYNENPNVGDSYCNGENGYDYFAHCSGGKIWLITGALDLSNWNPNDWLFETDLIQYFDNTNGEFTILANSFVEFYPLYDFDQYADGTYIINTQIA